MTTSYVVTEGNFDASLVERVLKTVGINDVIVTPGGRKSSVVSLAKSILVKRDRPVAVVIDSDTVDPDALEEQQQEYDDLMRWGAARSPYGVFLAQPELESVFFGTPITLERLIGTTLTEGEKIEGRFRPKDVLNRKLGDQHRGVLLDRMTDEDARAIAGQPLFAKLITFLHRATERDSDSDGPWARP